MNAANALLMRLFLIALMVIWSIQPTHALWPMKPRNDARTDVLTRLIANWQNSGQTVCVAHNRNLMKPVFVKFDAYPDRSPGLVRHARFAGAIEPGQRERVYAWPDGQKPQPKCRLVSARYQRR